MTTLIKGKQISKLAVGISWDPSTGGRGGLLGWAKKKIGMDLDLIAVAMQGNDPVRLAGLDSQDPMGNNSVYHTGDNRSGKGSGDDERVIVDFATMPSPVTSIVFVAAAFKPYTEFGGARNVSLKVYDQAADPDVPVDEVWPSLMNSYNAYAIAKASRNGDGTWSFVTMNKGGHIRQGEEQSLLRFAVGK